MTKSYMEMQYIDETGQTKTSLETFRLEMGQEKAGQQQIKVYLFNTQGNPVKGQRVRLVSSRNEKGGYDKIFPLYATTNDQGMAFFTIWTAIRTISDGEPAVQVTPDDAYPFEDIKLFAEVDGLWLSKPLIGHAKVPFEIGDKPSE